MSVSGTALSKSGIAQPVLINGGGHSSESNGVVKNGALFSEQQSALSQSSSMTHSSQSIQRQESSYSSHTESSASSYEYRRTRLTLADCQLELKLSILTIKPRASGAQFNLTTLNLDEHVGNLDGELVWGYEKFSASCKNVRLEGTLLIASCERGNKEWIEATLDLDEHITYTTTRRCFEAILPDPAFTEMMSSAAWMNVAVITQPDMRGFLTNPAFQETIKGVARRAVEEVINEMREEMSRAVEKAVTQVSIRAEEHVQYEMQSLTKRATLINTAAYSGLGGLTVMSHEQRRAYNVFAPTIGLAHHGHHGHLATMRGNLSSHLHHLEDKAMALLKGTPSLGNGHTAPAPVPEATRKGTAPSTPAK
ncbi:Cyanovirin-N domain protein [Mycena venus]|uniref:Cyanovirin-N domain protein n=1 Tax=Mycena venus TaxID=2733690 RepID=A0A8H6U1Q0_9AGAR|nr:Cyanovirin-N domain protein [Mycena venus]